MYHFNTLFDLALCVCNKAEKQPMDNLRKGIRNREECNDDENGGWRQLE